jgi:hypothetical protein
LALPSVAGAYMREHYRKLTGGCRGHVTSRIANHHAMESKYGPKGGPYRAADIYRDVYAYMAEC